MIELSKSTNVKFIDAPVSGGVVAAANGNKLKIYIYLFIKIN